MSLTFQDFLWKQNRQIAFNKRGYLCHKDIVVGCVVYSSKLRPGSKSFIEQIMIMTGPEAWTDVRPWCSVMYSLFSAV